ncbi:MAG TPA: DUF2971 domain-containing protein, partial [Hymenobacter sp.]
MSLKELMYSEVYFSSPEECNDPFDSKAFYAFKPDTEKWSKVIQLASKRFGISINENLLSQLTQHICKQCPLTFDEATGKELFSDFISSSINDSTSAGYLSKAIQELLKVYKPAIRYFASFSRTNSEPLMWSHYADRHKGYCLIFKAIDGKLNLSPNYKKDNIRRKTPNGITQEMSFGLPESFDFMDIAYKPEVELLDAFSHMPV